ncbi:MAG: hypothetical protein E7263_11670 [Lachnospiraceae bacterium]|nr:hypothetical protein [Lachnospiraceae bacterium]
MFELKLKSTIAYSVLALSLVIGLTGCGKKQVDYSDATEGVHGDTTSDASQLSEEDNIPEHIEYVIQGEMGDITVYADIKLPDAYRKCAVVELEETPFEDEDIKKYADLIYDEGSYFLYMPYNDEEVAFLKDKLSNLSQLSTTDRERTKFDETIGWLETAYFTEEDETDYEELKFYNPRVPKEGECTLLGEVDGRCYILRFMYDENNSLMTLERWESYEDIFAQDTGQESIDMRLEGNNCIYSQEEAEELAIDFVRQIGFEDYDVVCTNNVYCTEYNYDPTHQSYDSRVEGYNVYLGRTYDNYSFTYSSSNYPRNIFNSLVLDEDGNATTIDGYEYVRVYVDNQGLCQAEIVNPMLETGNVTDDVALMPFEKVDSVAQEVLKDYADSSNNNLSVMEIELGYGMIRQDGKVALVPMWYYFQGDYSKEAAYSRLCFVKINALDGSPVYDY